MKKFLIVIMLFAVSFSFAQELGLYQIGPTAGIIMPEDPYEMGFQIGAKASIGSVWEDKIGLFPVVNYWSSTYEHYDESSLSNFKIGVDGHYDLSETMEGLYAGAGLAINIVQFEYEYTNYLGQTQTWDDSDTKFGISLLAGYNLELSGKPVFIEAKYDIIDELSTFGVKAGMFFDLK